MIVSKSAEFLYAGCSDSQIESFCNEIKEQRPTHVFLTILWEAYNFNHKCVIIDEYMHTQGIPTTWVVTSWSKEIPNWQKLKCPVVFLDYFMWRSFNEIIVKNKSNVNTSWNPDAEKYLFLTGKPGKRHRIGLLYKLHQRRLLEQCDYSLFMSESMMDNSKQFVPELSDLEFSEFVEKYKNTPDNISPVMQPANMHYGGIPYDFKIYANSLFRVVSETSMSNGHPWLTEKTWLTILNKNPFIIAGDRQSCKYLKSLGFETFDDIFSITTYDEVLPHNERLECVADHVKQWLSKNFNKTKVNSMVEHNYNQLLKLSSEIKDNFKKQTGYNIDDVVDTCDDTTGF